MSPRYELPAVARRRHAAAPVLHAPADAVAGFEHDHGVTRGGDLRSGRKSCRPRPHHDHVRAPRPPAAPRIRLADAGAARQSDGAGSGAARELPPGQVSSVAAALVHFASPDDSSGLAYISTCYSGRVEVFEAIAQPTRREILRLLAAGDL